ncbi:unnamed protein product [Vitrella brassicaformis CCMP3155]|uniref:Uncharacterized protein n=1 Tax=Vitrella brassicaformis (strain CCMP3155) TaxID=1169540 RepID=A0A0G4G6G5_VITBC|nr:unnamed protein product [Vitrella brassicaformis CCMP3155]|eukprot:CEM23850.1 unnamed protein product [Vitrella brassicaformis CCMP3155]
MNARRELARREERASAKMRSKSANVTSGAFMTRENSPPVGLPEGPLRQGSGRAAAAAAFGAAVEDYDDEGDDKKKEQEEKEKEKVERGGPIAARPRAAAPAVPARAGPAPPATIPTGPLRRRRYLRRPRSCGRPTSVQNVRQLVTGAVGGGQGIKVKNVEELNLMLLKIDRGDKTEQTISQILKLHGSPVENKISKQQYWMNVTKANDDAKDRKIAEYWMEADVKEK